MLHEYNGNIHDNMRSEGPVTVYTGSVSATTPASLG